MLVKLAEANPLATSHDGLVRRCAEELDRRGLKWRRLALVHGLDLDGPPLPGTRILARSEQAFVREAERLLDDPLFGWSLGHWELRDLGLYGYAVLNAPDLRSALEILIKLSQLVSEAGHLDLRVTDGEAVLAQRLSANSVTSAVCLRMFSDILRELVGPDFRPTRQGLYETDPVQVQRLSDHAGMAIEGLAAPVTFLVFPASLLDRPLHGADAQLARVLQRLWDNECADLARRNTEMAQVQSAVVALLPGGMPTASLVAAALGISRSAFREKLDRLGTSLPWITDAIRAGLVARLLAQSNMSLDRAARALGFPEPAALTRAHCRWWGTPPRDGRGRLIR